MFSINIHIDLEYMSINFDEIDVNRHLYGEILFDVIQTLTKDSADSDGDSQETEDGEIKSIFYPIQFFDDDVIQSLAPDVIHESPDTIVFKSDFLDLDEVSHLLSLRVLPNLRCNCPICPTIEKDDLFEFCNLNSKEQVIKNVTNFNVLNQLCNSDVIQALSKVFKRSSSVEVIEEVKEVNEIGLTPIKLVKVTPNFNKPSFKVMTSSQVLIDELIKTIATTDGANTTETEDSND